MFRLLKFNTSIISTHISTQLNFNTNFNTVKVVLTVLNSGHVKTCLFGFLTLFRSSFCVQVSGYNFEKCWHLLRRCFLSESRCYTALCLSSDDNRIWEFLTARCWLYQNQNQKSFGFRKERKPRCVRETKSSPNPSRQVLCSTVLYPI